MDSTLLSLTGAGFAILTAIFYYFLYREIKLGISHTSWTDERKRQIASRLLLGAVVWAAFILGISATGFFGNFSNIPPPIMIVLVIPLVTIILVVLSKPVKELLPHIPAQRIVRLQVFRVFVELLIWAAFVLHALPEQMTFEGRNLDVVSGLLGLIVAYSFGNSRVVLYIYNFIGLALLINIVAIAILSMPTPFRIFMNEPANVLVAQFPFILLPGMLVPLAYGLHFLSLRQLGLMRKTGL